MHTTDIPDPDKISKAMLLRQQGCNRSKNCYDRKLSGKESSIDKSTTPYSSDSRKSSSSLSSKDIFRTDSSTRKPPPPPASRTNNHSEIESDDDDDKNSNDHLLRNKSNLLSSIESSTFIKYDNND